MTTSPKARDWPSPIQAGRSLGAQLLGLLRRSFLELSDLISDKLRRGGNFAETLGLTRRGKPAGGKVGVSSPVFAGDCDARRAGDVSHCTSQVTRIPPCDTAIHCRGMVAKSKESILVRVLIGGESMIF